MSLTRKETYIQIFNRDGEDKDNEILNFLIVSLFSADSNLTKEECEKNIEELNIVKEAVKESNLSKDTKSYWMSIADRGIRIVDRDYIEYNKNNKEN